MNGGHFDYKQYNLDYIADEIEQLVRNNDKKKDPLGVYQSYNFSEETLKEFERAIQMIKVAAVYAQRIDWLVSGEDSEKAFHKRLKEDLAKLRIADQQIKIAKKLEGREKPNLDEVEFGVPHLKEE